MRGALKYFDVRRNVHQTNQARPDSLQNSIPIKDADSEWRNSTEIHTHTCKRLKRPKSQKKKKKKKKKKLVKTKIWATALPSRSRAPRTSAYVDSASRQRPAPPLACDQMSHPFTDGRKRNRAITGNDNDQRRQMSHPYLFGRPATDTVSPIA